LAVLVAVVAGLWIALDWPRADVAHSPTIALLENDLTPKKLTRIELSREGQPPVTLEKVDGVWTLPGKWPVRDREVQKLVEKLTSLPSRFVPAVVAKDQKLDRFGLDKSSAVTAKLTLDGKVVTLKFGEEPAEKNTFNRPTYVEKEGSGEIVRLGPSLLA